MTACIDIAVSYRLQMLQVMIVNKQDRRNVSSIEFSWTMVQQQFPWKQEPEEDESEADNVCIDDGRLLRQKALGDGIITGRHSNLYSIQ